MRFSLATITLSPAAGYKLCRKMAWICGLFGFVFGAIAIYKQSVLFGGLAIFLFLAGWAYVTQGEYLKEKFRI